MNNYCNCTNPEPEEIKRGVIICLACNKDVLDTREQPDYDDNEAEYDRDLTHDEELAIDQHEQEKALC